MARPFFSEPPLQRHLEVAHRWGRGRFRRGCGRSGRSGEGLLLGRDLAGRLSVQAVTRTALGQRLPVGRGAGVDLQRPAKLGAAQVGQRQQFLAQADLERLGSRPAKTGREGFAQPVEKRVHILGHSSVSWGRRAMSVSQVGRVCRAGRAGSRPADRGADAPQCGWRGRLVAGAIQPLRDRAQWTPGRSDPPCYAFQGTPVRRIAV